MRHLEKLVIANCKAAWQSYLSHVIPRNDTKTAAMFGLDARIALAIFGALSVISGAALYSAIQHSKMMQIISQANEVSKAIEEYILDTGQNIPIGSESYLYAARELLSSSADGWNGPYLSFVNHSSKADGFAYPGYEGIRVFRRSVNGEWGQSTSWSLTCTGAYKPCGYWSQLEVNDCKIVDAIDKYVDGSVDSSNGKIRSFKNGSVCGIYWLSLAEI